MVNHTAEHLSPGTPIETRDRKVFLSTLWVFVMFNYLYTDVLSLNDSETLRMIMAGQVGSMRITPGSLLGAGVLVETAIAMVLLSRVLEYRLNRRANIIVGTIQTAVVALSVFAETPAAYYVFFATIEVACTVFIIWYAWTWMPQAALRAAT